MVNTVVTFGNNRLSSIPPTPIIIKNDKKIISFEEKFYLIFGILILSIILIPNILVIKNDHDDFTYHLLFIIHASSLYILFDFYICSHRFSIIIFHFNINLSKYFY